MNDAAGCYVAAGWGCVRAQLATERALSDALAGALDNAPRHAPRTSLCPHFFGEQEHRSECPRAVDPDAEIDCECPLRPCNCGHDAANRERDDVLAKHRAARAKDKAND